MLALEAGIVDGDEQRTLTNPTDMSIDEIAAVDIRMQTLLDERDALQLAMDEIAMVYKNPERRNEAYGVIRDLPSDASTENEDTE